MSGRVTTLLLLVVGLIGCGAGSTEPERGGGGPRGGFPGGGRPGGPGITAVPVEVAAVEQRPIAAYIETNGTLEAENEVDVVARTGGAIVELAVEEGDRVKAGQLLARLDDEQPRAQLEIARVKLHETEQAYERAQTLARDELISTEAFEQARSAFESAQAQVEADRIQLAYTKIGAPFAGLIVTRYVDFAQQVSTNTPLYRLSDFDPLLCPIQVPERDLPRLRLRQPAHLTVESFAQRRFDAEVLRISPVVDAATGTIKVTLRVRAEGLLRPGMFARVFVETDTRPDALVIPKSALSLDSIGDTVYVAADGVASRREVTLGYREGDFVEVRQGLAAGESVVVVGQDGLTDGTPIQVLAGSEVAAAESSAPPESPRGGSPPEGGRRRDFDPSKMSAEQLEQVKERMRSRGMTEEQIEERLQRMRERGGERR